MTDPIIEWAKELQSIAQAGLWYGRDEFDKERYQRVREIAAGMLAERTGLPVDKITDLFCNEAGYQTPKIDTRAAIFQEGRVLLVQERNGKWALPGGWCEYNLSPAENTRKEAKEEAGLDVEIVRLIAVQDRKKHNLPPYAYDIVKIFFLCRALGGQFRENIETSASAYFDEDHLPPLAEEKNTKEQIAMCFQSNRDDFWTAQFD